MGILLWIARAILILLVLRIILRMLFPARPRPTAGRPPAGGPMERAGGELVRDPQCGTYVAKARAIAVERGGQTVYFCSTKCRDEYGHQI